MANPDVIGKVLATVTFPVERGKIREFASAVLSGDVAQYTDPDTPGGIIAPPTFTQTLALWESGDSMLSPDLGLDFFRVVHGEQEMELLEPIRAGDTLTATSTITDVYSKENSRGQELSFLVIEVRFTNQHGRDAALSRMTLIETPVMEAVS